MSEIYENGSEITIKSENQNSLKCDSMSNKDFAASFCLGHNQSLSGYKMTLSPLTSSKSYDNLQRMSKIACSNFDCITHSNSKPTAIVVDATSNQSSVISHSAKPSTSAPACNSKLVAHHLISETHQDLVQSHDLIMDDCLVRSISSVNGAPTINQTSSTSDLPFIDDNLEPHSTGLFNCLCSFARRCCVV